MTQTPEQEAERMIAQYVGHNLSGERLMIADDAERLIASLIKQTQEWMEHSQKMAEFIEYTLNNPDEFEFEKAEKLLVAHAKMKAPT